MNTKTCRTCGLEKSIDDFYSGMNSCKKCFIAYVQMKKNENIFLTRFKIIQNYQKLRAGSLTPEDNLTVEQLEELYNEQNGCCAGCGKPFSGFKFDISHVIGIKNGGHLTKTNLQLLHERENCEQNSKSIVFANAKSEIHEFSSATATIVQY